MLAATLCLTVGPFAWELFRGNVLRRLFSLAAADTFYYLAVARNVAAVGKPSFDGERLTNGFHPLWQLSTSVGALAVRVFGLNDVWSLAWAIALGLVLSALAVLLLGAAWRRAEGRLPVLFLLVPFGAATLVQLPTMLHFWSAAGRPTTTLWGAVNGMETAAVVAAFAACFHTHARGGAERRDAFLIGGALALLALARLDHGIVAASLGAIFLLTDRRRWRLHALAFGVFAAVMLVYVAQNKLFFGSALPTSGTLKSTFPEVTRLNRRLFEKLFEKPGGLKATDAHRSLQMLIPPATAVVTCSGMAARAAIARSLRWLGVTDRFVLGSALGVLGLTAYDVLFVPPMNQGHWYYPVPNLFVTLAVLWAARAAPPLPRPWLRVAAGAALAAGVLYGYVSYVTPGVGVSRFARFYFDEAPEIRRFYQGRTVKLVEFDDGIVSFATGFPAFSGTGLVLDREAIPAARKERLLDLALKRGFDRFSTLNYVHERVGRSASTGAIRRAYRLGKQAPRCEFAVEYLSQDGHFSIIRADCGGSARDP